MTQANSTPHREDLEAADEEVVEGTEEADDAVRAEDAVDDDLRALRC